MARVKVSFNLDSEVKNEYAKAAGQLGCPVSELYRDAVEYGASRIGKNRAARGRRAAATLNGSATNGK